MRRNHESPVATLKMGVGGMAKGMSWIAQKVVGGAYSVPQENQVCMTLGFHSGPFSVAVGPGSISKSTRLFTQGGLPPRKASWYLIWSEKVEICMLNMVTPVFKIRASPSKSVCGSDVNYGLPLRCLVPPILGQQLVTLQLLRARSPAGGTVGSGRISGWPSQPGRGQEGLRMCWWLRESPWIGGEWGLEVGLQRFAEPRWGPIFSPAKTVV